MVYTVRKIVISNLSLPSRDCRAVATLLLATAAWGANPPAISSVLVSNVTHAGARITWSTDSASTTRIRYGLTAAYGSTTDGLNGQTGHGWFVSGLAPSTQYHYSVCSTDTVEACTPDATFVTAADVVPHPAEPEPPAPVDSTAMPAVDGGTFAVAPDCANLPAQINAAAAADGNLTHQIVIPSGTLCDGQYTFLAKSGPNASGSGVIIVRTGGPEAELPPEGTRVSPADQPKLATIRSTFFGAYEAVLAAIPTACGALGDMLYVSNAASADLRRCTQTSPAIWTTITVATGTSVPGTCVEGDWFYKTDTASVFDRYWWCLSANVFTNVKLGTPGAFANYAAITIAANAHHWRFVGLEITHIPIAPSYAAYFDNAPSNQWGSWTGCLVYVPSSSHHITFDRSYFHGQGYPSRLANGFCTWDGSHQAIINSYFAEMNRWIHPASVEYMTIPVNIERGPGPGLVENNYFDSPVGIGVFTPDDLGPAGTVASDYTVRRNHFFLSDVFNRSHASSNGQQYRRRHMLELKRGRRWLIDANIFDGGWAGVTNRGASITLTPRPGGGFIGDNDIGISDVAVTNNIIRNSPQAFLVTGHHDGCCGQVSQTKTFERLLIANNLVSGLSDTRSDGGSPTGIFIMLSMGPEDVTIRHNTVYNSSATFFPDFLAFDNAWIAIKGEGLDVRDNIFTYTATTAAGIRMPGVSEGTAALNSQWTRGGSPSYSVTRNAFLRAGGDPGTYPAGNFWPTSASALRFIDAAEGNLRLAPTSPYHSGGASSASDGSDLGVNQGELEAALAQLANVRVAAGQTQAVVRYTASDRRACTVDVATNSSFTGAIRVADTGTGRYREVTVPSLVSGTLYYYRVNCRLRSTGTLTTRASGGGVETAVWQVEPPASLGAATALVDYGSSTALGNATSPVACSTGCAISIPATSGQVLFHRLNYRNAGAATLATGAIAAATP